MRTDPNSEPGHVEAPRKIYRRLSFNFDGPAREWAERDAQTTGESASKLVRQIVVSAYSHGVSLSTILGVIPTLPTASGAYDTPNGARNTPFCDFASRDESGEAQNGARNTPNGAYRAPFSDTHPLLHLKKQQQQQPELFDSKTDRELAAEELLRRRQVADPSWAPTTTTTRYLSGLAAKLGEDEVAELLANRRDRLQGTAAKEEAARCEDDERRAVVARRRYREARLASLSPEQVDDLDRFCSFPEQLLEMARAGNDLAQGPILEERLRNLDAWLKSTNSHQPDSKEISCT